MACVLIGHRSPSCNEEAGEVTNIRGRGFEYGYEYV